ncbi:NADPH-dependent 7-cyano-7-deazaguanine reductase QueF [Aestuariirhabdus sp. Z084]|uniref:NADPH-dependent 7-cyano-7-deazaguanine reductase QueF n=1 Tax=Aestuariirhabdus haliotis TaxID=2918751 RepID=UPI00201B406B|nr:NADPH-dependent 7-cyano-7-deazaguanine reductase QueF [Aestuariirhabdus haliotis]MCL6416885.1 NADPH-dependent 7-cyano-7-deazaguanine reductase QueF [Aestuariirhabdus haliotis]MCL6420896.1 NADPH-dependent 7-cyano-7-deazaguanine reductase QueF [Aestuariirhabdus haliotis]
MGNNVHDSPLGKVSDYVAEYDPELLHPIARQGNRAGIGIDIRLPFYGVDIWNAYELSWLNQKGKPQVAVARFSIPCNSPNIIESKSFKLYLNSFNQTSFENARLLKEVLKKDLSVAAGATVEVELLTHEMLTNEGLSQPKGFCIDELDVEISCYEVNTELLMAGGGVIEEALYSRLLKSNCPVTGQPDWATLMIQYKGAPLCHESLLKYIVSFRQHSDFHEHCIERIFVDLQAITQAQSLVVEGRYVRRGGLDINPCRSLESKTFFDRRLSVQ